MMRFFATAFCVVSRLAWARELKFDLSTIKSSFPAVAPCVGA